MIVYGCKRKEEVKAMQSEIKKNTQGALAGVAQWIEHWPVKQRVAGLIPSQGTCPGWGSDPQ